MKKKISICLFTVIFLLIIQGAIYTWRQNNFDDAKNETTEQEIKQSAPIVAESMKIQPQGEFFLQLQEDIIVVYHGDKTTILLEAQIESYLLDSDTKNQLEQGLWIADENELYALLESYSS